MDASSQPFHNQPTTSEHMVEASLDLNEPLNFNTATTTTPIPERLTGSLVRCWAPRLHCGGITRHKHGATAAYLPPRPDVEVGAKAGAQPRPAASDTGSASGTKRQREASDSSEGESEDEDAAARQAARRAEELQWQLPPRDPVAPVAPPPKTMTLHSCGAKVVVDTSLGNPLAKGPAAAPVGKLRILDSGARGVGKGGAAPHTAVSVKQQRAVPVKAPKAVPVKAPKAAPVKAQKTVKAAASKPVNKPVEEPASTPVNAPSIAGQLCPSAAASGSGGSSQEAAAFAGQRAPLRASPPPAPILTGHRRPSAVFAVDNTTAWLAAANVDGEGDVVGVEDDDPLLAAFARIEKQQEDLEAHKQAERDKIAKELAHSGLMTSL